MFQFPKDPKKIRARIRRYERALRKEYERHGFIGDGFGKRYLLGPMYLIMGDLAGALRSFGWFEEVFPTMLVTRFTLCVGLWPCTVQGI